MYWITVLSIYFCSILGFSLQKNYDPANPVDCDLGKCDFSETSVCIADKCTCKPDYPYNSTSNKCEFSYCRSQEDCSNNLVTIQRVCTKSILHFAYQDYGRCVCPYGYTEGPIGLMCVKVKFETTIDTSCYSDNTCNSDGHQHCIDNKCRCDFDFHQINGVCQKFNCTKNNLGIGCARDYDRNRLCRNGTCYCQPGYQKSYLNGFKCYTISYDDYTNNSSFNDWWIIAVALLFIPFVVILVCLIRRHQNKKRRHRLRRRENQPRHNFISLVNCTNQPISLVPITPDEQPGAFNFASFQSNREVFDDPPPSYESIPGLSNIQNSGLASNSSSGIILGFSNNNQDEAEQYSARHTTADISNNQLEHPEPPSKLEQLLAMQL